MFFIFPYNLTYRSTRACRSTLFVQVAQYTPFLDIVFVFPWPLLKRWTIPFREERPYHTGFKFCVCVCLCRLYTTFCRSSQTKRLLMYIWLRVEARRRTFYAIKVERRKTALLWALQLNNLLATYHIWEWWWQKWECYVGAHICTQQRLRIFVLSELVYSFTLCVSEVCFESIWIYTWYIRYMFDSTIYKQIWLYSAREST